MDKNLKRHCGSSIIQSDIEGLYIIRSFVYPTNDEGEMLEDGQQEVAEWLISEASAGALYNLLGQVLGKAK